MFIYVIVDFNELRCWKQTNANNKFRYVADGNVLLHAT
jgi:hypothetical protein